MKILIKNATIISEDSSHHLQNKDILIHNGIIKSIDKNINSPVDKIIEGNEVFCSIGLIDIGTHSGEPGFEHRETIESLSKAALAGGYTNLLVFPNTYPFIQTKAEIKFIKEGGDKNGVTILPIGALSKDGKGNDIAEYIDMHQAGAIAFSDGLNAVQNGGLLLRALQYANQFDGIIIHHPDDSTLSSGGQMHEGVASTTMGMKGSPDIAEVSMLQRDLLLLEYSGSKLVSHAISSAKSVLLVKTHKKTNQNLFCTVSYLNLKSTDQQLEGFDSLYKVQPPLRSEKDKNALIKAIKEDTIDAIVSNHVPLEEDLKKLEYTYAAFGATGLETAFIATLDVLIKDVGIEKIVQKFTNHPRKIFGITIPKIDEGQPANLCIFDTKQKHVITQSKSLSTNNPFINVHTFDSKILMTVNGKEAYIAK